MINTVNSGKPVEIKVPNSRNRKIQFFVCSDNDDAQNDPLQYFTGMYDLSQRIPAQPAMFSEVNNNHVEGIYNRGSVMIMSVTLTNLFPRKTYWVYMQKDLDHPIFAEGAQAFFRQNFDLLMSVLAGEILLTDDDYMVARCFMSL